MIQAIIISAPSGTGKTTILKEIFKLFPNCFSFSISATTRFPREGEINGKDYYFLSLDEFEKKKENDEFLEFEQVYQGLFYGTLKSEIDRINKEKKIAVFDVDVKGGVNIKNKLKDKALSIFIMPPSIPELKERLTKRGSETKESLNKRIERAEMEIDFAKDFDRVIINDNLQKAVEEFSNILKEHLS
ncbi:MAG: guanylate kinase [Bacteroidales bacterium]|jgi:guanylate kinase|nr:guanylate kinase [Bacteroidales bacterium]